MMGGVGLKVNMTRLYGVLMRCYGMKGGKERRGNGEGSELGRAQRVVISEVVVQDIEAEACQG